FDNEFLDPTGDDEVALRIAIAQIARAQPAFGIERLGGFRGVVEVALHDVRAAQYDFADFTIRGVPALFAGDPGLHAARQARRSITPALGILWVAENDR